METEEKERRRLAEELHDGLGPLLSSVKMHADLLLRGTLSEESKMQVPSLIKDLVAESISNIREISANLMPHVLYNYGLVPALKTLISKVTALHELSVELQADNWVERPDKTMEMLLYRVISELITNSLKHAQASAIRIILLNQDKQIEVHYSDNGKGFDVNTQLRQGAGMGLHNIINRIKSQQGLIKILSAPGKGFEVQIALQAD